MQLSAEISLYPLADEYLSVIKEFVERLAKYEEISVNTNTMSTQVFGEFRTVMAILTEELERVYQHVPSQVLVCKFINRDLNPHG
ncbi:YkoF family thiamine/hydroxymethylpyrimidine-binding protein [Aliidiomarina sp.]|uniref:YkoF family thiamine/hydroxymethylpyrimidine-binding protein n=1 Tax=Aliidiomarina sp. TaxID=1872439 RepID=UPI003A4D5133